MFTIYVLNRFFFAPINIFSLSVSHTRIQYQQKIFIVIGTIRGNDDKQKKKRDSTGGLFDEEHSRITYTWQRSSFSGIFVFLSGTHDTAYAEHIKPVADRNCDKILRSINQNRRMGDEREETHARTHTTANTRHRQRIMTE